MDQVLDVVVIGYGPVGQTTAALLGRLGHSVSAFERHRSLYALPRAGHVDHEVMRVFQSVGATDAMLPDLFRCSRYGWRNQDGATLLDIDWSQEGVSGWASDYLMYQPYLEDALDVAARSAPAVTVEHGWEAVAFRQKLEFVEIDLVRAGDAASAPRTVRSRFVIGADGANSAVRGASGIELEDLGFREQWLVADFKQNHPLSFDFDNGQICDPARPMCLFQLGRTHRRFEFMVMPGEDPASLAEPETVWDLVAPWIGKGDADLIRATTYTFRSANAVSWSAGRALLVGDAAHLMPPFMGQGMCSGVRDAANLAWKLDLVLRGAADPALLDTYELERKPHVGEIIDQAVALGRISCIADPVAAAERDAVLLGGLAPPPPPFPWLEGGILHRGEASRDVAGRLGPQGRLERDGAAVLADDVLGVGWQLISHDGFRADMTGRASRVAEMLGLRHLEIDPAADGPVGEAVYRQYFAEHGVAAVLVRPDFYVFAGLNSADELNGVIEDLADQLSLREMPAPEPV